MIHFEFSIFFYFVPCLKNTGKLESSNRFLLFNASNQNGSFLFHLLVKKREKMSPVYVIKKPQNKLYRYSRDLTNFFYFLKDEENQLILFRGILPKLREKLFWFWRVGILVTLIHRFFWKAPKPEKSGKGVKYWFRCTAM